MLLIGKKIAFALTDSFYIFDEMVSQIAKLVEEGAEVLPIMSFYYNSESKYVNIKAFIDKLEKLTGKKIINSLKDIEFMGEKLLTDVMVIAPCSRKYNC